MTATMTLRSGLMVVVDGSVEEIRKLLHLDAVAVAEKAPTTESYKKLSEYLQLPQISVNPR